MMETKTNLLDRELSWLDFNARVLEEAYEKENPLMERMRFLAITASNLDEFTMVRVAGVMDMAESKRSKISPAGMTAEELLPLLDRKIRDFVERQYSCLSRSILPQLEKSGIRFVTAEQLTPQQKTHVDAYFNKVLFPVLTPMAVDRSRPFPMLANKSLNIVVRLQEKKDEKDTGKKEQKKQKKSKETFAVVQVPSILPRFLELPETSEVNGVKQRSFILLEEIIIAHMASLFELHEIISCSLFRITRDSDLSIDEESNDFLEEIKASIKKRKTGRPVRLEVETDCDNEALAFLEEMLPIEKSRVIRVTGPLDLTLFSKFASIPGCSSMCYDPIIPVAEPADFVGYEDIFAAIRAHDCMIHHPYESFDVVVDFVRAAAEDPDVLAIKQTLYRVSGHSPIVAALMRAAENGKQVTVLVELKARFDEENNIHWAQKLEKAGCHVVYGLSGLKTHCKILLVVRREEDGIRRYVHMGTGNYNDSTARIYTDMGVMTCKEPYGSDASSLFNVLTGYSRPPRYNRFVTAPIDMRPFFREMIEGEIACAAQGLPSGITAKVNSLVDPEIIELLYKASQAGVPVKLIVRGICCLIPGVPGLSENITVHSIVGQLLEHSRIFRFECGGKPRIWMGSADWMQRNLDHRVELVFPIEAELMPRAEEILEVMWSDNVNTRVMQPDTSYQLVDRRGSRKLNNSHRTFSDMAKAASQKAQKQFEQVQQTTEFKVHQSADQN
ncbi:MAG TPA: polyphosphate kinase 1 [Candidatus Faecivivens stercorigallinarum]|nr:polyphosphate kinase 1 [Candidatus Faecivivens stercorigallinarum]